MKMDPVAVYVLQSLLVLMIIPAGYTASCPRLCSCPQPTELHCTFRSLIAIPSSVSKQVKRMNLGFNNIHKIPDKSLAGLRKLELLMIHGNNIHNIHDGAFRDLVSLQILKISYNKLKEINRHTFTGLWSLARLHLDHNQLEFIHPDAFQGLTSLLLLQLEGNQLQQLHPGTFTTFTLMGYFHISTLRHLHLSDNGLTSLPSRLVMTMPHLENLYLHGNPWICDCNMRWLHDLDKMSPGTLKCKKDRNLPSGQLCPVCSSPRHIQQKELQALENLVCSSPIIRSPHKTYKAEDIDSKIMTTEDFKEPFGNTFLDLCDEHGNEVNLKCSVGNPKEMTKINWEQLNQLQMTANINMSVDLFCPVQREKYERLWRLIAYYSNVPAHLKRVTKLSKEPNPTCVYRQDTEKDVLYYTGVKMQLMAQPAWLMQTSVNLQLNKLQSSPKMVKLILSMTLSETVEVGMLRRQKREWVMIKSTNSTHKVQSAILGKPSQMNCNVQSSGQSAIYWIVPNGSKLEAPYSSPENNVSVSRDGRLVIESVSHSHTGIYYCIAKVPGDLAVLPFYLTVHESSSPPSNEDVSLTTIEEFAGNPIYLPCMASGSPDAEINWILPNSNIVNFQVNSSRATVYSNGTLHIAQIQVLDGGYYKCIAINQHGVDTLVSKITVVRTKGLIRPSRRLTVRPQSASGVNTQIKVPTEDTEEASGDTEVTSEGSQNNHLDPMKRKILGGVAPGRRGVHLSRNMWRRPALIKKPTRLNVEVSKVINESRKRINKSNSKIDPERWADILARIRGRNTLNTVTPIPVQHTTQSQRRMEGSSASVTVQNKKDLAFFTTHIPSQNTQMNSNKNHTPKQEQETHLTSNRNTSLNDKASNSPYTDLIHATVEPHTMQTAYNLQHTTHEATSNIVLPLPHTTSVSLHAVNFWQASTSTASSSNFFLQENHNTHTDNNEVKTADWSKVSERSRITDKLNVTAILNRDREHSWSRSQIIPSVSIYKSKTSQEENGNYLTEIATLQAHNMLKTTVASPKTTLVPTTARRRGSARKSLPLQQPFSRGKKRGGRNRPNRRKQKLNKPNKFIATTPANDPVATVRITAPTQLKIEPLEVSTAKFNTTVPFTSSQAESPGRLSHKESTVSWHEELAVKPSSIPALPFQSSLPPLAKPLILSTSAAPPFPTTYAGVVHGNTSLQTALGKKVSSPEVSNMLTTTIYQSLMTRVPPFQPIDETQKVSITGNLVPVAHSGNSFWDLHTAIKLRTDVEHNQYTETTMREKMLLNESGSDISLLPSPSPSNKHEYTSANGLITAQRISVENDLKMENIITKNLSLPAKFYHSSSQNKSISSESVVDKHLYETANVNFDALITRNPITIPSSVTSRHDSVISSREASHFTLHTPPYIGSKIDPSLKVPTQEAHTTLIHHTHGQQINPIITTQKTTRASDYHSATQTSPALKLTTRPTFKQTTTAPKITVMQTHLFRKELLTTTTQDVSRMQPGQEPIPKKKPTINNSNFQTFTVKAKTDAQLSCEVEGLPMPIVSWTKVVSGESIAQNTKFQRFEVHLNGTLIIRNTQPMDGGQYLCTVQNQYGTDKKVVDLVVLSQHPWMLQPQNRDITVHLGDKVDLECQGEGHLMHEITWVLPNHVHMMASQLGVSFQQRVSVLTNGTLQISQATFADTGIYKCIGSSAAGVDTLTVYLYVSAKPLVIQQAQHETITFPEGGTAYFHCTADGAPPPVIHWITPDGTQLTASQFVSGHNFIVYSNGTLYIQGLSQQNAGRYDCLASNAVASSRRTVILSIKRNLFFLKASIALSSPQRTDVNYGSMLLLDCVATGQPDPQVIWRTPSKKLVDAQYSFDPRIKVFPNGTLTILSVTDIDSGDYLCLARNKMGDDYVLLRVNVLTRPAKIEQTQQPSSQEVVYGGDLKVDCVASGLPTPEISWVLPDGTMVNLNKQRESFTGGRSHRYVVFENGTLYFNDVGMPEEGDYTCYAVNQLGKDEMKVRVKVNVTTYPPQIQSEDSNVIRVFFGETVSLRCNAIGEPIPVTTWISPAKRVISPTLDKYKLLEDGTLVVEKVQRFDGGNYTCIARNNKGQDHKVIRLKVLVTPPVINGLIGPASVIKVTAVQDQRTLVDCVAKGIPTPHIMWILPGNVILPAPYNNNNRMTVHQNGTLEIMSARRTDSGQLACIASNEGGEVRMLVDLDVQETVKRPQIRGSKINSLTLTVGKAMTLNCSFESLTKPHITWVLPNGTPLLSGARFSKFFHQPGGSLIISNPSVGESGMYRCLGHTSKGLVEHAISLLPGRKPQINNRYNSPITVMNGEIFLLHCLTSGEPLRLTWTLPSGVVLNRSQRAGRYAVLENGTLAVQKASTYDSGSYVCRAVNEYGSSLHSVSVIMIASPPQITNGPPSVTYAKHGVAVQLNCMATGIPRVEVAWETPDKTRLAVSSQPRLFGNKYLHPQGSLIIQNPTKRDVGIYRCIARNAIGIDSIKTFLNVF